MNQFDAFVQPHKEFRVRTPLGGYLTVGAILLSGVLFVTEFNFFLELESKDTMVIDRNQDRKNYTTHIALTLPEIPCAAVGINVVDMKKLNVMRTKYFISKKRVLREHATAGIANSAVVRDSLKNIAQTPDEVSRALLEANSEQNHDSSTVRARCPSCFTEKDECCLTCEDVLAAWARKNSTIPDYTFEQCAVNKYKSSFLAKPDEGCHIEASFTILKKPAKLLLGLPTHVPSAVLHPSFVEKIQQGRLNWTHKIHSLTFGPHFPGFVPVLDGAERGAPKNDPEVDSAVESATGAENRLLSQYFQYDVHIIPTAHVSPSGGEIESHQYSVTDFMKQLDVFEDTTNSASRQTFGGVLFDLSFTPFQVSWIQSRKQWTHFLTECCAIVGGVIAFSTMVDNLLYRFVVRLGRGSFLG